MCGITGIYHYGNSRSVEEQLLRRMCGSLRHRGPDDEGVHIDAAAGLGIRRLAIIDLQTGHQPVHNEDSSVWVVLNGEIYNFQELRASLEKKHSFFTNSDTEAIVHLYEEYGMECVQHLRGMFAFALWDSRKKQLFIAKDRLGKKPLFYTNAGGTLAFASEIKPLLEFLGKTPEIDPTALDLYLTYQYIPSPHTIFKGISSLPPAHLLACTTQGVTRLERYWDIDFRNKTDVSFNDACATTKKLLREATRLRMIADVPLGAFLSGGHDSSIIVGLMSELSPSPVKTFSIGFEETGFSELPYARRVAEHFHTDHHEIIVKPDFIELLPKIARHYGQPFADPSALPSYLVSHETRKHVTVALNGDGGDETFGGYTRYRAMKASRIASLPFRLIGSRATRAIARLLPHIETNASGNFSQYLYRFISGLGEPAALRNLSWNTVFSQDLKAELYAASFTGSLSADPREYQTSVFENAPADSIIDRTLYTDFHTYLPEGLLVKMDIASMANSLETRSPFLDHKVVEFAASLPDSWKLKGSATKHILKETFRSTLPEEIMSRGKMGFGIPAGQWFRTSWKEYFKETVLSPKALSRGYFDKGALEHIFNEHLQQKRDHANRLWALLMLEAWHQAYIDK